MLKQYDLTKNGWGQFTPEYWGQFAPELRGQFQAVNWGLFGRNFHFALDFLFLVNNKRKLIAYGQ